MKLQLKMDAGYKKFLLLQNLLKMLLCLRLKYEVYTINCYEKLIAREICEHEYINNITCLHCLVHPSTRGSAMQ